MALLEETPAGIEPCLLDTSSPEIADLVASLSGAAHTLGSRLHPRSAESLAELVRVMNCYYSNLIEDHNTTPREIERVALGEQREALGKDKERQVRGQHAWRNTGPFQRHHCGAGAPGSGFFGNRSVSRSLMIQPPVGHQAGGE